MFHECLSIKFRLPCPRLTPPGTPWLVLPETTAPLDTTHAREMAMRRAKVEPPSPGQGPARATRKRALPAAPPDEATDEQLSAKQARTLLLDNCTTTTCALSPAHARLCRADADGNYLHAKRPRETAPPPSNTSQCSCSAPHAGTGTGRAPDQNDTRRQVLVAAREGRRERASAATAEQTRLLAGCGPAFGRLSPPTHRRRRRRGQRGGNGHRGGEGGARSWRWCGRDGAFSVAPTLLACFPQAAS